MNDKRALPDNSQAGLSTYRTTSIVQPSITQPPALAEDAISAVPTFKRVA